MVSFRVTAGAESRAGVSVRLCLVPGLGLGLVVGLGLPLMIGLGLGLGFVLGLALGLRFRLGQVLVIGLV